MISSALPLKLQIFKHTVQHDMQMLADAKVNLAIKPVEVDRSIGSFFSNVISPE